MNSEKENTLNEEVEKVLKRLRDSTPLELTTLLGIWRARSPQWWIGTPEIYQRLGDRILRVGEPLLAYDVLAEGLEHWPQDVRLRQLLALALARSRATHRANQILRQLYQEEPTNGETLGILARTHKDLWRLATNAAERQAQLKLAHTFYNQAYQLAVEKGKREESYYTGINTATTALLLGEKEIAYEVARQVRKLCLQVLKQLAIQRDDFYWVQATLGEAALILGDWAEAEDWYAQATEAGRERLGNLSSTRRNARLLMEYLGGDKVRIEQYFQIPHVVVFTGHMIDRPDRVNPRFPPQLESTVSKRLLDRLKNLDAGLGYASAACGSDILFLEAILELRGEIHIVLPYQKDQFMRDSVAFIPGADWGGRFERVFEQATEVIIASEQRPAGQGILYDYANLLLYGLASIRAEQLETELVPLAVWDGKSGDGMGGTASVVVRWQKLGHTVELIDLAEILRQECPELVSRSKPPLWPSPAVAGERTPSYPQFTTQIMAMLFADVASFSRLMEEQIPRFVQHFLGTIAELMAQSSCVPVVKETWGDGLYLVFSNIRDTGRFALELCDHVNSTNWTEKGLPNELNLRIALHAGPVYLCKNPITQQPACTGTHVTRTARIEPITPPGQVYASQAFAALASAEGVNDFKCEYVGQIPLAKGYGTFPTYHVRRP